MVAKIRRYADLTTNGKKLSQCSSDEAVCHSLNAIHLRQRAAKTADRSHVECRSRLVDQKVRSRNWQ